MLSRLIAGLTVCVCGNPIEHCKEREKQLELRAKHLDAKENTLASMQDELDAAAEEFETRWQHKDLQVVIAPWLKRYTIQGVAATSEKGWTPLHVIVEQLREGLLDFHGIDEVSLAPESKTQQ